MVYAIGCPPEWVRAVRMVMQRSVKPFVEAVDVPCTPPEAVVVAAESNGSCRGLALQQLRETFPAVPLVVVAPQYKAGGLVQAMRVDAAYLDVMQIDQLRGVVDAIRLLRRPS